MAKSVLRLEDVTMQFGGFIAVDNLSREIFEGEIVALIGPNGAGKTTAFNAIIGVYEPTNGAVYFHDKLLVTNYPRGKMKKLYAGENRSKYTRAVAHTPDYITKLGIARTFQNIRLFKSMTVFENVLTAMHLRKTAGMFSAIFRANRKEEQKMRADADELLRIVDLYDVRDELATSLPYGKQRKLEIARALATKPTLLLLDEPAAGMNPQETREKFDLPIFLIEHHMNLVMDISDRIYVIDFGKRIAHGVPAEIQRNQKVIDAYLGVEEDE